MAKDNLPIGTIMAYAGQSVSLNNSNWKFCDGDTVYKSDYPTLFNVLGDRWGPQKVLGGGEIEFTLPDLRGVFLRGVNAERKDEFKDPDVDSRKAVSETKRNEAGSFQMDAVIEHTHTYKTESNFTPPHTSATGGSFTETDNHQQTGGYGQSKFETRPKNAYVHYIIKVKDE